MCSSVPVPQKGTAAGGKGIPKTWVVSLVKHVTEKSGKSFVSLRLSPRRAFYRWFSQTQQQQEEIKVTPPLKRHFPSVLSFLCRNQFYPSQHQAPEPDLPCGLEDGFFQLQPRGPVECWLPDWWVFLGAWSCPCQGHHDLALEGFS